MGGADVQRALERLARLLDQEHIPYAVIGAMALNEWGYRRVTVDVEDYRKRQKDRLISRSRDLAKQVQRSGKERELEAMNAYERKIVHDAVAPVAGVETVSTGEDPDRRVVIRPES